MIGDKTYAIVVAKTNHVTNDFTAAGIQVIDLSDPANPTAVASRNDGDQGFENFAKAIAVDTFMISDKTYAIVTIMNDDGLRVIDLSDPENPTAVGSAVDGANGFDMLDGAAEVDTFVIGAKTYAIVASYSGNGIQVLDLSDPTKPTGVASARDGDPGFDVLGGPRDVKTFMIGDKTYAIVATGGAESGIQVIDLSDPTNPTGVASAIDGANGFDQLGLAWGVDTFVIGDKTYAIVTDYNDDGFQVIDLSDPTNPAAVASATDNANGFDVMERAGKVHTFVFGGATYAIMGSYDDNGVQVIDLSNPANPTPVASATDSDPGFKLNGAHGVDSFVIGAKTYVIVSCEGTPGNAEFPGSIQVIELV